MSLRERLSQMLAGSKPAPEVRFAAIATQEEQLRVAKRARAAAYERWQSATEPSAEEEAAKSLQQLDLHVLDLEASCVSLHLWNLRQMESAEFAAHAPEVLTRLRAASSTEWTSMSSEKSSAALEANEANLRKTIAEAEAEIAGRGITISTETPAEQSKGSRSR